MIQIRKSVGTQNQIKMIVKVETEKSFKKNVLKQYRTQSRNCKSKYLKICFWEKAQVEHAFLKVSFMEELLLSKECFINILKLLGLKSSFCKEWIFTLIYWHISTRRETEILYIWQLKNVKEILNILFSSWSTNSNLEQ